MYCKGTNKMVKEIMMVKGIHESWCLSGSKFIVQLPTGEKSNT